MDRTVFAACAYVLVLLGLVAGCDRRAAIEPQNSAPRVLAELKAASPGPWRQDGREPIAITSLERPTDRSLTPPARLERRDIDDLGERWNPGLIPLDQAPADPDAQTPGIARDAAGPAVRSADSDRIRAAQGVPAVQNPSERPAQSAPLERAPVGDQGAAGPSGTPRRLEQLPPTIVMPQYPVVQNAPAHDGPPASPLAQTAETVPLMQEAEERVRQGFRLAERSALYLARAELIAALELVAQARDVRQNTRFHSDALDAGLAALEESHDFTRQRSAGKQLDVARAVSGHKTPILKNAPLDRMAPLLAAERYYTYAQQRLTDAAAPEPCGSKALFGLAKATLAIGQDSHAPSLESRGQAKALYQAALAVDGRNYRAAHELGVLEARNGAWDRSRDLLVHSVRLCPHPTTHRNLAMVYAKLGETRLSELARQQATVMEKAGYRRGGPAVQWVDPATFAGTAPTSDSVLPPVVQPAAAPSAEPSVSTAKRGVTDWLPWKARR